MILLSIDPGTTHSAFALFKYEYGGEPFGFGILPNEELLLKVHPDWTAHDHLAFEMVASFGMPVGKEVFETVLWMGRFMEASGKPFTKVYRQDVKLHLCNSVRAKDGNVRQAIIDRFGGKDAAIGKKKTKGPLYGASNDVWSALAVGLVWLDKYSTKGT